MTDSDNEVIWTDTGGMAGDPTLGEARIQLSTRQIRRALLVAFEALLTNYQDDVDYDPYRLAAAKVFQVPDTEVDGLQRLSIKRAIFDYLYQSDDS